jgi:hypothetical protein
MTLKAPRLDTTTDPSGTSAFMPPHVPKRTKSIGPSTTDLAAAATAGKGQRGSANGEGKEVREPRIL